MRFAVFTVSTPDWGPEETVAVLAELGYDGVEWRVCDQVASAEPGFWWGNRATLPFSSFVADAPRVRRLADAAGLAAPNVGTYTPCGDLAAVDEAMRGTVALGAPSMRVLLPDYDGSSSYLALRDRARADFVEVAALAAEHGVRALVEIHMDTIVPSACAAAAFLEGLDPQRVGVIHDAGNMVFEGHERYRLGLELLGDYLAHVHLKNARWQPVGRRSDGSTAWAPSFAPLTDGIVDVAALFGALRSVGYDGWVSFEDFSTDRPLLERVRDNLSYARAVLDQVTPAS